MPADTGVDQRRACFFDSFCKLYGFVKGAAAIDQIQHRQAINNNEIRTDFFANRTHDFDGKTHTTRVISAPFVVALVGSGCQKLVNQIAFGTHDFDAIVSSLLRQARALSELFNEGQDFFVA
ncbi:hypothetical protein D3C75_483020 [compost metagenome]